MGGGDPFLESPPSPSPPLGGGEGRITKEGIEGSSDQSTGGWVLSKIRTQASVNDQAAEEVVVQSSSLGKVAALGSDTI